MRRLFVVENVKRWPPAIPVEEVVSARAYLSEARFAELRTATVFNLCRTSGYQTLGYYVSLLAAARGHRPLPSVATLQDLRLLPVVRIASEDLDTLIQRSLKPLRSPRFELSIYFGRNVTQRYDRLAGALYNQFPAPLLRATFVREQTWALEGIRTLALSEIPESHLEFVAERAAAHTSRRGQGTTGRAAFRYDLAILCDPEAQDSPSNSGALRKFERAARALDMEPTLVTRDDYASIAEFDALFLRETTYVDHHTYRFARRAAAEGLVVIDDPESILRCTNKVFQAELFARKRIPTPATMVVHDANVHEVAAQVGLPCVLKRPDSSFSRGVVKAETEKELLAELEAFLEDSELAIAQKWMPSSFDWRIGVLDRKPLFACRYHMARGHWQIISGEGEKRRYGKVDALPLAEAPAGAVEVATRAASLIGDGLYGVDVKEVDGRFLVMEVNDNPNVDAGYEDREIGDALYEAVMRWFRERLDARGSGSR